MNPYTGDLIRNMAASSAFADALGFRSVPKSLQGAAEAQLGGKDHVRVDLRKGGPLQVWAKKKRREKMAAKSRRANRK